MAFDDLLRFRMNGSQLWMKRLELSNSPDFLHPKLYKNIEHTVSDAFHYDFNLIVEEFSLYQQLAPKMQTQLIQQLFSWFIRDFKYFFNSCEIGFRNEFIIKLYARVHRPGTEIQRYGREAEEVVLIQSGQVDMFTKEGNRFMVLPLHSIFNDYQLLFNLKSNISFKAHTPTFRKEEDLLAIENQIRTMNLNCEHF